MTLTNLLHRFSVILSVILVGLTAYYAFKCLVQLPERITWHWANSHVESQPVWGALQVARGQKLYTDFRSVFPAVPLTYGTLAYWIPGQVANLLQVDDAQSITRILRLFSATGFLATLIMAVLLSRQSLVSWRFAVCALLPIFWFPYICEWSGKGLPDFPAIALSLSGLYLLRLKKYKRSGTTLGVILWIIGWHFKPIVLTGPIAYISLIFWDWRVNLIPVKTILSKLLPLTIFTSGALIVGFVLNSYTNGLWQLHILGTTSDQAWTAPNASFLIFDIGDSLLLPVLLLTSLLLLRKYPLGTALLLETLFGSLLLLKEGATINYLAGACIIFGIVISQVLMNSHKILTTTKLSATCCTVQIYIIAVLLGNLPAASTYMRETIKISREEVSEAAQWINPSISTISLNPYFALVYNLPCPFMDGFHAVILERSKVVSFQPVADDIVANKYPVVIGDYFMVFPPSSYYGPLIPTALSQSTRENLSFTYQGQFLAVGVNKHLEKISTNAN